VLEQVKLEHLQVFFPRLTESNQQYVLGLVEGLKYAQGRCDQQGSFIKYKPSPYKAGNLLNERFHN